MPSSRSCLLFVLSLLPVSNPFTTLAKGLSSTRSFGFLIQQSAQQAVQQAVQQSGPIHYTVKAKDTYYSIARQFNVTPAALMAANPNKKQLHEGDQLMIPKPSSAQVKNAQVQPAEQTQKSSTQGAESPVLSMYQVQKGETLYSISRAFHMNFDELKRINQLQSNEVRIGQMLKVSGHKEAVNVTQTTVTTTTTTTQAPTEGSSIIAKQNIADPKSADSQKSQKQAFLAPPSTGLYVVQPNETVFAISTRYGIPVARIQELNNLKNNEIHTGQTLRLADAATASNNKPQNAAAKNMMTDSGVAANAKQSNTNMPTKEPERNARIPKEFKEEGMGSWQSSNSLDQAKSVALHRTAPIGTVLKVTNPLSKKSIFVKVVGSFVQTEENKNAIVIISKSAAQLIGAIDPHFRVELSYAY